MFGHRRGAQGHEECASHQEPSLSALMAIAVLVALISVAAAGAGAYRDVTPLWAMAEVGMAAGLAGSAAMLITTRRKTRRQLSEMTRSLSELAAGNLDIPVTSGAQDGSFGPMIRAIEDVQSHTRQLDQSRREISEAQAEAMARRDWLTGLPNRRVAIEALEGAIAAGTPCAVLRFDLDRFKAINDIHGHDAGDAILCAIARRCVENGVSLGTVARMGGDEFIAVVPGVDSAIRTARLINRIVREPVALGDIKTGVTATVGSALFPQDCTEVSLLLRAAGVAMAQGKSDGRDTHRAFTASMRDQMHEGARLDADLRRAIPAGEIRPHYQPFVSAATGELVGFEILARWHHPEHGIIMPTIFVPIADERGLLTDLTYRIFHHACSDARSWPDHLCLSLNLAPSQLKDPLLSSRLTAILRQTGIAASRIEIEITENALISDIETTKSVLAELQRLGMRIALDDFGTGYSSLSQLRDLPFDKIKIDKSFIHDLEQSQESATIVRAIIELGKKLGVVTTAEGIEDAGQWATLSRWGCDFGQGYLFGKPASREQVTDIVADSSLSHGLPRRSRSISRATLRPIVDNVYDLGIGSFHGATLSGSDRWTSGQSDMSKRLAAAFPD